MSSYENYTRKSGNYDKTREPVGTEIFVGCFAHAPVPLDRTVVLDADAVRVGIPPTGVPGDVLVTHTLRHPAFPADDVMR